MFHLEGLKYTQSREANLMVSCRYFSDNIHRSMVSRLRKLDSKSLGVGMCELLRADKKILGHNTTLHDITNCLRFVRYC